MGVTVFDRKRIPFAMLFTQNADVLFDQFWHNQLQDSGSGHPSHSAATEPHQT